MSWQQTRWVHFFSPAVTVAAVFLSVSDAAAQQQVPPQQKPTPTQTAQPPTQPPQSVHQPNAAAVSQSGHPQSAEYWAVANALGGPVQKEWQEYVKMGGYSGGFSAFMLREADKLRKKGIVLNVVGLTILIGGMGAFATGAAMIMMNANKFNNENKMAVGIGVMAGGYLLSVVGLPMVLSANSFLKQSKETKKKLGRIQFQGVAPVVSKSAGPAGLGAAFTF